MPNAIKELMREKFCEMQQGGIGMQAYTKCFVELYLFALEDVATDALIVDLFRWGLRDEIQLPY